MRAALATELRYASATITGIDAPSRSVSAIISTESKDRWGSIIRQNGLRWASEDLPVLPGHTGDEIARTTRIYRGTANGLPATMAVIQFPDAGVFPESDRVFERLARGLSKNFSIGFQVERQHVEGRDLIIDAAEIVEISTVAVPGNPQAELLSVTRQMPEPEGRRIMPAPFISEGRHLGQVSILDFAALDAGLPEGQRDVGPAREWHQELCKQMGGAPRHGIRMPFGLLFQKRDAATAPGGTAAALAGTELARGMLEALLVALREQSYFGKLGISTVTATEQTFTLPSTATKGTGSSYITRDSAAAPGVNPTFVPLNATPHTAQTLKIIPRSMLQYTAQTAEEVIRADMAGEHLELIQTKFLFGNNTTTPTEPDGLLRHCTVSPLAAATQMTRAQLIAFIDSLESKPVDEGLLKWFFTPRFRRTLEATPWVSPDTARKSDLMLIEEGATTLVDYPFITSRYLRSNVGAASNESDVLFGDFSQSFLVSWQSAVVATNPYSSDPAGFRAGGVELLVLSDHDHLFRDAQRVVYTSHAISVPPTLTALAASNGGGARSAK